MNKTTGRRTEFSARSGNQLFQYNRESEIHEEILKELSPPTQEKVKNSVFEKCSPKTKSKYNRVQRIVLRKVKKAELAFNFSRRAPNSPKFSTPNCSSQKLTRARLATPTDPTPNYLTPIHEINIGGTSQSEDDYYEDPYQIELSSESQPKLYESDILNPRFTDSISLEADQAIRLIQQSTFDQGSVAANTLIDQGRLDGDFRDNTPFKTSAGNSLTPDNRVSITDIDKTRVINSPNMERTPPNSNVERQLMSTAAIDTANVAAAVAQIPIIDRQLVHTDKPIFDDGQNPFQPQTNKIPRSPINTGNTTPVRKGSHGGGASIPHTPGHDGNMTAPVRYTQNIDLGKSPSQAFSSQDCSDPPSSNEKEARSKAQSKLFDRGDEDIVSHKITVSKARRILKTRGDKRFLQRITDLELASNIMRTLERTQADLTSAAAYFEVHMLQPQMSEADSLSDHCWELLYEYQDVIEELQRKQNLPDGASIHNTGRDVAGSQSARTSSSNQIDSTHTAPQTTTTSQVHASSAAQDRHLMPPPLTKGGTKPSIAQPGQQRTQAPVVSTPSTDNITLQAHHVASGQSLQTAGNQYQEELSLLDHQENIPSTTTGYFQQPIAPAVVNVASKKSVSFNPHDFSSSNRNVITTQMMSQALASATPHMSNEYSQQTSQNYTQYSDNEKSQESDYYTSQESDYNSDYEDLLQQQCSTVNSTLANTYFSQTSYTPAVSSHHTMTTTTGTVSFGDRTSSTQFSFGPPHTTQGFTPYNPQMTYANTTPGYTAYTASHQGSAASGSQSFNFMSNNQSGQSGNNGQNQPNPSGGFNNSNPPHQGGNNFNPPGQGGNGYNPPNFNRNTNFRGYRSSNGNSLNQLKFQLFQKKLEAVETEYAKLESLLKELRYRPVQTDASHDTLRVNFDEMKHRLRKFDTDCSELIKTGQDLSIGYTTVILEKQNSINGIAVEVAEKISFTARQRNIRVKSSTSKDSTLQPPVFNPDNPKSMNFFEFSKKFDEYVRKTQISTEDVFHLLKDRCCKGQVEIVVKHLETTDQIWDRLRENYGDGNFLMQDILENIRKQGKCPDTPKGSRDWSLRIHNLLDDLIEMGEVHNLSSQIRHNDIIYALVQNLPRKTQEKYHEKVAKHCVKHNQGQAMLNEQEFTFFRDFLAEFQALMSATLNQNNTRYTLIQAKEEPTKAKKAHSTIVPAETPQIPETTQADQATSHFTQQTTKKDKPAKNKQSNSKSTNPSQKKYPQASLVQCSQCPDKHTHILHCPVFQQADAAARLKQTQKLKICMRCLRMGTNVNFKYRQSWFKKHEADNCYTKFACSQGTCNGLTTDKQKNIVVCADHTKENKSLEPNLIKSLGKNQPANVQFFFTSLASSNDDKTYLTSGLEPQSLSEDSKSAILMTQTLYIDNRPINIFYDTGCNAAAISSRGVQILQAPEIRKGPTTLHITGDLETVSNHGDHRVSLEMHNKELAHFNALQMDKVTHQFPLYELQAAYTELENKYKEENGDSSLPLVEETQGGSEMDILLGLRYRKYFPKLIFELDCGLAIYQSQFEGANGSRGIIAGPHESFLRASEVAGQSNYTFFLTAEMRAHRAVSHSLLLYSGICVSQQNEQNSPPESHCSQQHCENHTETTWDKNFHHSNILREEQAFFRSEDIATTNLYRCLKCRKCTDCKNSDRMEAMSLQEEREQSMIESSLTYNEEEKVLYASLPFVHNPHEKLTDNKHIATAIFNSQMRQIEKNSEFKDDILQSHDKLASAGYLVRLSEIPPETRELMQDHKHCGYFIPWKIVYKTASLSTPVRLCFNASSRTPNNLSLNETLAKGENTLAKLFDILIDFRARRHALAGDITKCYNQIKLEPEYYKYQKYLWKEGLRQDSPLETRYIRTLIYGVKSSGNQTIEGLRMLAKICEEKTPKHKAGARALAKNSYMDDILTSVSTLQEREQIAKSISHTLSLGSMEIKCYTKDGQTPSEQVSSDGQTVGLLGYLWAAKEDSILLDIKELSFGKIKKGKPPQKLTGSIRDALAINFTRRVLTSKVAQIFDPLGLATAYTAKLKLDLHSIVEAGYDWDQPICQSHLDLWCDNMTRIQNLKLVKFPRAIIPANAKSPQFSLITSCDASERIIISTVHARFELKDGSHSCQLIAAKSKLSKFKSIPKSELRSALLAATLCHAIYRQLKDHIVDLLFVSDSAVSLFWLTTDSRPLQATIRSTVIEIRRLTDINKWYHVPSEHNVADIGTRSVTLQDISETSHWQKGKPWMNGDKSDFPLKSALDIKLTAQENSTAATELKSQENNYTALYSIKSKSPTLSQLRSCYQFSQYLYDPCQRNFSHAVRIICTVRHALKLFKTKKKDRHLFPLPTIFSEEETKEAENYYFRLGTLEVKHFVKPSEYKNVTTETNGILYYNARILCDPDSNSLELAMLDIDRSLYTKPVLHRYSPISYSVMSEVHVKLKHRGTIPVLSKSRQIAYILSGRKLAEEIRLGCPYCTRYKQRMIKLESGPTHPNRIICAPPYFHVTLDLTGPYTTYSINKRATMKCWALSIKCTYSGHLSVKIIEGYDVKSLADGYFRHAAIYTHPRMIFIDRGSQLLKFFQDLQLTAKDLESEINNKTQGLKVEVIPTAAHSFQSLIERSHRELKKFLNTSFQGIKLSPLALETAMQIIVSDINDLPICLGSNYENFDRMDLITPNRLVFGRNSDNPLITTPVAGLPSAMLRQKEHFMDSWFKAHKEQVLQKFIAQPTQNEKSVYEPKVGDICVFKREDAKFGARTFRVGRIILAERSRDGKVRRLTIEYKNSNEGKFRETTRSTRDVAIIHKESELCLVDMLNEAKKEANAQFFKQSN